MVTVSFVSIKGGVGKTHILICAANCLAACGLRVLVIDTDLNNSLSFYYLDDEGFQKTKELNVAKALSNEENNLNDFTVPTGREKLNLLASSPYLSDLRTMSEKRLRRMIGTLEGLYDIALIDCHPTYDNIVLNAINASNYIITPVIFDSFSYNGAVFMRNVIARDTDKSCNWYVLINGYNQRYAEAKKGWQLEIETTYRNSGFPLTPPNTWMPLATAAMRGIVDKKLRLTPDFNLLENEKRSNYVEDSKLYNAVVELAECFIERKLERVKEF